MRQFVEIKSSYSQARLLPRLGKIRLGKKAQTRTGKEYPVQTSYFVCPQEVVDVYGEEPTELDVMFPMDNKAEIFRQKLGWYGSTSGLKCHGNMEEAERLQPDGSWKAMACPCEHLKTDENPQGECTEQSHLMVILPKVSMGGCYQITTGSYHSTVAINSAIDYIRALAGRIAMLPLKLRRVPRDTHHGGKKQRHFTLELILDANLQQIDRLRQDPNGLLIPAQYRIEGPIETNPAHDPVDYVTEEDEPSDLDEKGEVDAEALADKSDEELERLQEELRRRRAAKEPPPSKPSTGIPPEAWKDLVDQWAENPYLNKIKNAWIATKKISNVYTINAKGQQDVIAYMIAEAEKIGVKVPL